MKFRVSTKLELGSDLRDAMRILFEETRRELGREGRDTSKPT